MTLPVVQALEALAISTRCREASAKVTFRLGDGRMLDLAPGDQQMRRIDQAWASTVHAFEGGTVDTVIAAMEAKHPNLTNLKTLYVEISRARDRAEPVTDDKPGLREQLEAVIGVAYRGARSRQAGAGEGPRRRAGRGPEHRPRWCRLGIAAAGTDLRAGHGEGAGAEERRSRPRAVKGFAEAEFRSVRVPFGPGRIVRLYLTIPPAAVTLPS